MKQEVLAPTFLRYDTDGIENDALNSSLVAYIRYRWNVFIEPLPSNDRGIQIQTHGLIGGIMKYAVEMGSVDVIYIPSFIKIGIGI
jgi:hypothetical protein